MTTKEKCELYLEIHAAYKLAQKILKSYGPAPKQEDADRRVTPYVSR
jgi:hypothetical protein